MLAHGKSRTLPSHSLYHSLSPWRAWGRLPPCPVAGAPARGQALPIGLQWWIATGSHNFGWRIGSCMSYPPSTPWLRERYCILWMGHLWPLRPPTKSIGFEVVFSTLLSFQSWILYLNLFLLDFIPLINRLSLTLLLSCSFVGSSDVCFSYQWGKT